MSDPLSSDKRLWKVKVIGQYGPKPKRAWWTVLVEAADSDQAMAAGAEYVQAIAPSDRLWDMFEAREASTVQLPLVLL